MTMTPILESPDESKALVRAAAFRLLLVRAEPVSTELLAREAGIGLDQIASLADHLEGVGRIRRDEAGLVVGSAGLSVVRDRHRIEVDGRQFWTWCAYDILGIFGALGVGGSAWSPSLGGPVIVVEFQAGHPQQNTAVLFRPDTELMACCENVYEEWCPNSNLFVSQEQARAWAREHSLQGRILSLDDASGLAATEWVPLVTGLAL